MLRLTLALLAVFLFLSFSLTSLSSFAGKKHCQKYLAQYKNVQAQQRAGYSAKKGRKLKEKEAKTRKTWWQCEQGKLKKSKSAKAKTKAKTKGKTKQAKNYASKNKQRKSANTYAKSNLAKSPTYGNQAIVVKQRYSGKVQKQWLAYYRKPDGCGKPKTMKKFTFCIEDKHKQQVAFEQELPALN